MTRVRSVTRVKVCCISSPSEARLAVDLGASALGLVSEMPSGPGVIPESAIAEIVASAPSGVDTFLLTSRLAADDIVAQQRRTGATTLQLVDDVGADVLAELRDRLPETSLVQVVHVRGEESLEAALAAAPLVDALLLDSGDPAAPRPELGGTGRVHDWDVSRAIVAATERPVYLAGGLRPDNVGAAIEAVAPYGVDLCSGVRTGGALDEAKLRAFMSAVRS